jgi:hypothetical protein
MLQKLATPARAYACWGEQITALWQVIHHSIPGGVIDTIYSMVYIQEIEEAFS